jgi:PAS domain S-box-containing protein
METQLLRQQDQLLATILDTVNAPIVVLDDSAHIQLFNAAAERISGVSTAEAVGSEVWTLVHPDDRERAQEAFRDILAADGDTPSGVDVAWIGDRTRGRRITWTATLLRDPDSDRTWLVCTGDDRTGEEALEARARELVARDIARTTQEDALRNSEARFSGIIQLATDAIISIDETQTITLFNRGAEGMFGWAASEVLGRSLDTLIPEGVRRAHSEHIRGFGDSDVAARTMGERGTIRGLRRSGEEFPAEASILKLDVDGERIFTVLIRDVSERHRGATEQRFLVEIARILASSLDLDTTLSSVADCAVGFLADYCVLDVRDPGGGVRRIRAVAGAGRDPEPARVLQDIELDRDRPHLMSRALLEGEPELVGEVTQEHLESLAQGPQHLQALQGLEAVSYMVVPLSARGRELGALLLVASKGRRRYDEKDLALAREVGARAGIAVDNAELYRSAQRAIQARDDILGVVSHDLGNPLQAVFIGLEALERVAGGGEKEEYYLSAMRRSADLMQRLIHELLEVRRMEEGQLSLTLEPEALAPLVSEALGVIDPLARVKSVTLADRTGETDLPLVRIDRDRVLQVLSNLIGNAVKHTPHHGTVGITARAGAGNEVQVSISDTGSGIPPEHHAQVFERFWRAEKTGGKGIGLGLAIAKGIVHSHGGRIWVESEEGSGSTFHFTLPAEPIAHGG